MTNKSNFGDTLSEKTELIENLLKEYKIKFKFSDYFYGFIINSTSCDIEYYLYIDKYNRNNTVKIKSQYTKRFEIVKNFNDILNYINKTDINSNKNVTSGQ